MAINAKDIAELRKSTGAGMLDSKNALTENDGDIEAAKEWLRKKGLASAAKRSGRDANEGAVEVSHEGNVATLVELICETDFVAKGEDFSTALKELNQLVYSSNDLDTVNVQDISGQTVEEYVTQLGAKLGENISLGRVKKLVAENGIVDSYKHLQNGRGVIGVLVQIENVQDNDKAKEVAHDIALHIASAAPRFLSRDEVSEEAIENEKRIIQEMAAAEGKPEAAMEKIIQGRMTGFFKESCLLDQQFVKDPSHTITQLVESISPEAKLVGFERIKIGE
jgi:elongation factor Ts